MRLLITPTAGGTVSVNRPGLRSRKKTVLVVTLVAVVVLTGCGVLWLKFFTAPQRDARSAVRSLKQGDLSGVEELLSTYRGESEFAHYFTAALTPRDLGDALATTAGTGPDTPLGTTTSPQQYELTLTDLAGTLGLATQGVGGWALPQTWTTDFITATTTPSDLYGTHRGFLDSSGRKREAQDSANKSNLLLLLARGYWSEDFLQAVTTAYHSFDVNAGEKAWPQPTPSKDARYAPSPQGVHLTDGILALAAALTANPAAAEWAFTDFLPGTQVVDGTDHVVGSFTHFLMFEHKFPKLSDGTNVGMTATLTALSAAVDSADWSVPVPGQGATSPIVHETGPRHDAEVLHALVQEVTVRSACSWDLGSVGTCLKAVARAVWSWLQAWGHVVLDLLSAAPLPVIGAMAATANAAWYAADGDYAAAGLCLAAVLTGVSFVKLARVLKAGPTALRTAKSSDQVAEAARSVRAAGDVAAQRVRLRAETRNEILGKAPRTTDGRYIDPNTRKPIEFGHEEIGHKPGHEWRCIQQRARTDEWSRTDLIEKVNNPSLYQVEDSSSNRSHQYESRTCRI